MIICKWVLLYVVMFSNLSASILREPKIKSEIIDAVAFVAEKPLYQILLHQKSLMLTLKKMKSIEVLDGLEFLFTTDKTKDALRIILSSRFKKKLLIYYLAKGCDRRYKHNRKRLIKFAQLMVLNREIIEVQVRNKKWQEFITGLTNSL